MRFRPLHALAGAAWLGLLAAAAAQPVRRGGEVAGTVAALRRGPDAWRAWFAWGPRCDWRDAALAERQHHADACGAAALAAILRERRPRLPQDLLWSLCRLPGGGTSLARLESAAQRFGHPARFRFDAHLEHLPLPAIVHLRRRHFVVLERREAQVAHVLDPACGLVRLPLAHLVRQASGAALVLQPGDGDRL